MHRVHSTDSSRGSQFIVHIVQIQNPVQSTDSLINLPICTLYSTQNTCILCSSTLYSDSVSTHHPSPTVLFETWVQHAHHVVWTQQVRWYYHLALSITQTVHKQRRHGTGMGERATGNGQRATGKWEMEIPNQSKDSTRPSKHNSSDGLWIKPIHQLWPWPWPCPCIPGRRGRRNPRAMPRRNNRHDNRRTAHHRTGQHRTGTPRPTHTSVFVSFWPEEVEEKRRAEDCGYGYAGDDVVRCTAYEVVIVHFYLGCRGRRGIRLRLRLWLRLGIRLM